MSTSQPLALLGGEKAVTLDPGDMFKWPIVTSEDEEAVVQVLRDGNMSGTDITKLFEAEYAEWVGTRYGLGYCNGTSAVYAAMWACGVGAGDEVIAPSMTYWATCASALSLGAAVNFADIDPDSLCIDPSDIEHRIGPRTRAIIVVHYAGHPADMDSIMEIANRHGVKVIEDVSHAQGSLYKGRQCGTMGHIGALSMMAGKSFAIGEAGVIVTDDKDLYERCIAYGHYERTGVPSMYNPSDKMIDSDDLLTYAGAPMGGHKHRMNQTCAAMGRVQLKYYPKRIAEIQKAMNRFWDLLEDVPGVVAHRPGADSGSTMGGWYAAHGLYRSDALFGLSCEKFCEALRAEGFSTRAGANGALHLHPLFHEADIFNMGKPTMVSFGQRDVRQWRGALPVSESINEITFSIPWFKHDRPEIIDEYVEAIRKVTANAESIVTRTD